MGYRLHVAKTYRVEYGDGYFNHCTETINNLLGELCPSAWFDDEQRCFSTRWEIDKEELQEAIQTIKNETEYYDRLLRSRNVEYDAKEFAEILERYLKQSDKNNSYIILEWF